MSRLWEVSARAVHRVSGDQIGEERSELVDSTNELFQYCRTTKEVKEVYESFWNNLNSYSDEVVQVTHIIEV